MALSLFHRQPFKGIFIVYWAAKFLARLPCWIASYYLHDVSSRPIKTWPLKRCLWIWTIRDVLSLALHANLPLTKDWRKLKGELKGAKHVWLDPVEDRLIRGEMKRIQGINAVEAMPVVGFWYGQGLEREDAVPIAREGEKIIYHMHWGGFAFGAAHPSDPASVIIRRLRRRCLSISRVFSIEYRISSEGNTNPFPAPLLDALAGYAYLVNTLKFLPENIVFAGDSAGGNLALTLVRYILDHAHEADFPLHPPKALVLFSPWADISDSHYALISPAQIRADYLELPTPSDEGWLTHAGRMYAGQISLEEIRTNPYFSSASLCIPPDQARGLFKGFPKTFISCGGAELFKTHLVTLRDRMVMDAEQEGWVTFDEVEGAVHGFPGFEWQDPEGSEALARAARWIDGL